MHLALEAARAAQETGEVPVGAVVVSSRGEVLAQEGNRTLALKDPSAHAEVLAIRAACKAMSSERLVGCDLYVTLEPCTMCVGLISLARIRRLYFAAYDPKGGGIEQGAAFFTQKTCHHRPEVYGGIEESRASKLLEDFFRQRR